MEFKILITFIISNLITMMITYGIVGNTQKETIEQMIKAIDSSTIDE